VPNLDNFLGSGEAIAAGSRAVDAWRRISEKPSSITLVRGTTELAEQTVRVEYSAAVREVQGSTGRSSVRDVIVFGIQDHPTLDDTDIQRDDLFKHDGVQFRVVDVIYTLGEKQGRCEANG
jgi:hypothetical protein